MSEPDTTKKADAAVSALLGDNKGAPQDTGVEFSETVPLEAVAEPAPEIPEEERIVRKEFERVSEKEREEWLYSILYGDGSVTWAIPLANPETVYKLGRHDVPTALFKSAPAKLAREIRKLESAYGATTKMDEVLTYKGNVMLLNTVAELLTFGDKSFGDLGNDITVKTLIKRVDVVRDALTPIQLSVAVSAHEKFTKKLLACVYANQQGFF